MVSDCLIPIQSLFYQLPRSETTSILAGLGATRKVEEGDPVKW